MQKENTRNNSMLKPWSSRTVRVSKQDCLLWTCFGSYAQQCHRWHWLGQGIFTFQKHIPLPMQLKRNSVDVHVCVYTSWILHSTERLLCLKLFANLCILLGEGQTEWVHLRRKALNSYFILLSLSLWFPFIVDFQISHMYFLCHLICFMASHKSQKSRTLNSDLSLYNE